MSVDLNGIINWLKGWFYDKGEVNTIANSKLNANLTTANKNLVTNGSGDVVLEDKPVIPDVSGKIDTAGTGLSKSGTTLNHSNSVTAQTSTVFKKIKYDGQGHITGTANVESSDLPSHNHSISNVTDLQSALNAKSNTGHTHSIASVTNLLSELNSLDSRIDSLESVEFVKVVTEKPTTASAETMNILWVVANGSSYDVWVTKNNEGTYSWEKIDDDILDDLSIDWSDIQNNPFSTSTPSSFANANHTHGNISNDGKIGTTTGKIITTGTNGVLQASDNIASELVTYNNNTVKSHLERIYDAFHNVDDAFKDKADKYHSSTLTTYGVGTSTKYGHNKVINNLTTSSYADGNSLSAYQGYVLKGLVDDLNNDLEDVEEFVYGLNASSIPFSPSTDWGEESQIATNVSNALTILRQLLKNTQIKGDCITSIALVPKSDDNTGAIRLYYGDEPTNNS